MDVEFLKYQYEDAYDGIVIKSSEYFYFDLE